MTTHHYFLLHMGAANAYAKQVEELGVVAIDWNEIPGSLEAFIGLDRARFEEAFLPLLEATYPLESRYSHGQVMGQVFTFLNGIGIGDTVLTPFTKEGLAYVSTVVGEYTYLPEGTPTLPFKHRRAVSAGKTLKLGELSSSLRASLDGMRTIYGLDKHAPELKQVAGLAA